MKQRIACPVRVPLEQCLIGTAMNAPMRPGPGTHPIRHATLINSLYNIPGAECVDSFHALSDNGQRYFGLFQLRPLSWFGGFDWVLSVDNRNDGSRSLGIGSGIVIPEVNMTLTFHEEHLVTKKFNPLVTSEVESLVNETVEELKHIANVELDRRERYLSIQLTPEKAHHIICLAIESEVISGRVAFELLETWKKPDWDYVRPRNLWSLFILLSWFLNRLKASELIERTQALHKLCDGVARFKLKQTNWVQDRFA